MNLKNNEQSLGKIHTIALLAAFSLFLSSIEYLLPRPIPFFRYGLANIAILLVIQEFSFKDICMLALLKVLGLGILNGTFASYVFLFSLLGTFGAVITMYCCAKWFRNRIGRVGISVAGALVSNLIQIILAVYYIFGTQAWIIAPYLLLFGICSGGLIGLFSQYYYLHSQVLPGIWKQYHNDSALKAYSFMQYESDTHGT